MKPKISILLAAYKSEELLDLVFIPSLKNWTCDWELIIRDNGGNGNLDKYKSDLRIKIIGDGSNIGLNKALNQCASIAQGDYYYLPHSDMVLLPNSDTALLEAAKGHAPGSFLFCSRSVEPTMGHTQHHIIKNYGQEASEFQAQELMKDFSTYKNSTIEVGARMPFFLDKFLWKKMNGVDENYFSYCTDDDLVQEAWHCKVRKFWMVYGSLVYHLQGKSNNQQRIDKDRNEPYEYFVKKWKNKGYTEAEHPGQWHPKMIPFYQRIK